MSIKKADKSYVQGCQCTDEYYGDYCEKRESFFFIDQFSLVNKR